MYTPKLYESVRLNDGRIGDVVYILGDNEAFIVEVKTNDKENPYDDVTVIASEIDGKNSTTQLERIA